MKNPRIAFFSMLLLVIQCLANVSQAACSPVDYDASMELYRQAVSDNQTLEQAMELLQRARSRCANASVLYKQARGYIAQKQWDRALESLGQMDVDNSEKSDDNDNRKQAGLKAWAYLEKHEEFKQENSSPNTRALTRSSPWLPKAVHQLERVRAGGNNSVSPGMPKWFNKVALRIDNLRVGHLWQEAEVVEYHSGLRSGIVDRVDIPVHFDYDKSQLRAGSDGLRELQELERALTAILKSGDDMVIQVRGYTDVRGSEEYNVKLSERRAKTVYTTLARNPKLASRLETLGMGKWDLLCTDDTEQCHSQNRRVELRLIEAR